MKRSSRGSQLAKVTTYRRVPGAFGVRERSSPSDQRGSPPARVARAARAASRARAASGAWNRARPITRARALPGGRRSNVTSHEGAARVAARFRSSKRSVVTAPPLLPAISVAIEKREEAGWRRSPRAPLGPVWSEWGRTRACLREATPFTRDGRLVSIRQRSAVEPEGRGVRQSAPHRASRPKPNVGGAGSGRPKRVRSRRDLGDGSWRSPARRPRPAVTRGSEPKAVWGAP
jgi:hypothetical protein